MKVTHILFLPVWAVQAMKNHSLTVARVISNIVTTKQELLAYVSLNNNAMYKMYNILYGVLDNSCNILTIYVCSMYVSADINIFKHS